MSNAQTVEPTARRLAQMRSIASTNGLPPEFADRLAGSTLPEARAGYAAQVMAGVLGMPMAQGLTTESVAQITDAVLSSASTHSAGAEPLSDAGQILMTHLAELDAAQPQPRARAEEAPTAHGRNSVGASWDHGSGFSAKMQDALYARMNSSHTPTMGREYVGASLVDMAYATLQANGHSLGIGRNAQTVMKALHSTSDFPLILVNTANRRMLDFYEAAGGAIKRASREVDATDFREIQALRLSGSMELDKVKESGEITHGTLNEAGEKWQVATYAKIFGVTRQAMVNDDLKAFDTISRVAGQGAALTEAKVLTQLIVGDAGLGPVMSDGNALFHADHGNLASSGGAISITTLSTARTAMRRQTGLSKEPINVTPMFLVVPPELETVAEQIIAEITAADADKVNPFTGKLTPLVDPLLTDAARWYLAAAPGSPDGLQHAYLDGQSGPQIMTREGWEVDGMEFKARLDFGAGVVDHRAWYMNPGA